MKTIAMVINKIEWIQTVQYVAVNGIFRSLAYRLFRDAFTQYIAFWYYVLKQQSDLQLIGSWMWKTFQINAIFDSGCGMHEAYE